MTVTMLAPSPAPSQVVTSSGNTYTPDADGFIAAQLADVLPLLAAGWLITGTSNLIGRQVGVNFNITTDQPITMFVPQTRKFRVTKITARNTSVAGMSTAAGGIYPAVAKGGTALVAAGQVYTGLTNASTALDLTLATANAIQAAAVQLYFALTTGQGAAATADIDVFGDIY
jgi:hypothetical protein